MSKHFKIGNLNLTLTFRHRWDGRNTTSPFNSEFRDWRLGVWVKKNRMVGNRGFKDPKKWAAHLVNSYMVGIDLLVCKMWVECNRGGKILAS